MRSAGQFSVSVPRYDEGGRVKKSALNQFFDVGHGSTHFAVSACGGGLATQHGLDLVTFRPFSGSPPPPGFAAR